MFRSSPFIALVAALIYFIKNGKPVNKEKALTDVRDFRATNEAEFHPDVPAQTKSMVQSHLSEMHTSMANFNRSQGEGVALFQGMGMHSTRRQLGAQSSYGS